MFLGIGARDRIQGGMILVILVTTFSAPKAAKMEIFGNSGKNLKYQIRTDLFSIFLAPSELDTKDFGFLFCV